MNARERVWVKKGTCFSGVHVTTGSSHTMTAEARKVSVTHAIKWTGSAVVQLLRSKVKRRANSYTTGVRTDQMKETVTLQASSCVQVSGLPMEAMYTCAPVALNSASTVHNTKPMAQTRAH